MTDPRVWVVAGGLVGLLLGGTLQHQREPGWFWGGVGGAIGLGFFALICYTIGKLIGEPGGWAIGGPIGLAVGGAILLIAIGNPRYPLDCAIIGGIGGAIAGAICGPISGLVALLRSRQQGFVVRPRRHLLELGVIVIVFCFGLGAIILVVILRSE